MDYSGDENELTQNVCSKETCSGEFYDFSDILASEWCYLENIKQAKLNANERCACCDENLVVEGSAGSRNISVVTNSELENRKEYYAV